MSMDISLGEGMPEREYELRSRLHPMAYSDSELKYLNRTFTLTAGEAIHLELGPVDADPHSSATYDAVVVGPDGTMYAFGFTKTSHGGWYGDYQY